MAGTSLDAGPVTASWGGNWRGALIWLATGATLLAAAVWLVFRKHLRGA